MPNRVIYTVGHSTHPIDVFIGMLKAHGVTALADVRTLAGSNAFPQFNQPALKASLRKAGIAYRWIDDLGGRRHRQMMVNPATNAAWENKSFRHYADYATLPAFAKALMELEILATSQTVAFMCAEALWWRCHRRIISDHLLARGWEVQHVMSPTHTEKAKLNGDAVLDGTMVTYPAKPGMPKQHAVMDSSPEE